MSVKQSESLDDRRPSFLRQLVGNQPVVERLSQQMKGGTVPNRALFYGPTGSGKTTIARIVARHFFCENRVGIGDPCGGCENCLKGLENVWEYHQWTAARLEASWRWWEQFGDTILRHPSWVFFLDESQDLTELHQKEFYDRLEYATALVIFATTHKNALKDALVCRFGANVFEMTRPTREEVAEHLAALCPGLGVRSDRALLSRVAEHYGCDLRKCVDLVHAAARQAPEGVITDAFLDAVFCVQRPTAQGGASPAKRLIKL